MAAYSQNQTKVALMLFQRNVCMGGECMGCITHTRVDSISGGSILGVQWQCLGDDRAARLHQGLQDLGVDVEAVEARLGTKITGAFRKCISGEEFSALVAEMLP